MLRGETELRCCGVAAGMDNLLSICLGPSLPALRVCPVHAGEQRSLVGRCALHTHLPGRKKAYGPQGMPGVPYCAVAVCQKRAIIKCYEAYRGQDMQQLDQAAASEALI